MLIKDKTIECFISGRDPIVFDMELARVAEARVRDISYVKPDTAPELLALFNEAYIVVARYCAQLEYEYQRANSQLERRSAVVLLDEVPAKINEKGLGNTRSPLGSEDIRNAFIQKDEEYQQILESIASLKATKELMYMKLKAFDMAYTSIKKILGEQLSRYAPTLNGGPISSETPVGKEESSVDEPVAPPIQRSVGGWSKPKH